MRILLISTLAAASLVTFAAPAIAEPVRSVSYGDLDVSSKSGRTALVQRVTYAVDQVCGDIEERNIHSAYAVATCRTDTWAQVQPQLNAVLGSTVRVLADASLSVGGTQLARR